MTSLSAGGVEGMGMEGGRGRYRDVRARYRVPRVDPRGPWRDFFRRSFSTSSWRTTECLSEGGEEDRGGDR